MSFDAGEAHSSVISILRVTINIYWGCRGTWEGVTLYLSRLPSHAFRPAKRLTLLEKDYNDGLKHIPSLSKTL